MIIGIVIVKIYSTVMNIFCKIRNYLEHYINFKMFQILNKNFIIFHHYMVILNNNYVIIRIM